MPNRIHRARPWPVRPLAAALGLAFVGGAAAQVSASSPYYIGVRQAFTHDSNVFRLENDKQGDTYSSTGIFGGIDQPFGRQRFYANANVNYNRFFDLDALNNTSYGTIVGLDWSTANRISGNLRASLNEGLATYDSSTNTTQLTQKNLRTESNLLAQVQYGLVSLLSLEGGYSRSGLRYSAAAYAPSEIDQDAFFIGLKYRPSGLMTLGIGLRHTTGDYPNYFGDGSEYGFKRNDLDLTATWVATGQSTLDGRLSIGKQSYAFDGGRDFSGVTGQLTWLYRPTGKLLFSTTLLRDTGSESSFQSFTVPATGTGANGSTGTTGTGTTGTTGTGNTGTTTTRVSGDDSRLTTSIALGATYAATAKINVSANGNYIHRSLANTRSGVSIDGTDDIKALSLGASYAFNRAVQFACSVSRESRSIGGGQSRLLSYPYSANIATCSAQLALQL